MASRKFVSQGNSDALARCADLYRGQFMIDHAEAPRATYRLQLNKDFDFAQVGALVPYLAELGVSHVYLSPILKARPGSTHGYDTVDHHQINPELGTLDQFRALSADLQANGLKVLLDFVPNHMGVGGADNLLWLDVLQNGPDSEYADWFDIDWLPANPAMHGKLLVPFLGVSYPDALAAGEIVLKPDAIDGLAVWAHGEHKMPLRHQDLADLKVQYGDADRAIAALNGQPGLDALIARQHWRLAHHSVASDEINYRRFFVNSDLAGIRIERPEVFDHAHALVFQLIEEGLVHGLRIDHVDGLLDPKSYLQTLRAKSPKPIYLLIEKILAPHERLRASWPVEGTTGYEFGARLTRLLTNPEAEPSLSKTYENFISATPDAVNMAYACKLRVMDNELSAELFALARAAFRLTQSQLPSRDLTQNALRKALREVIAALTVYRTYRDAAGVEPRDTREIGYALAKARQAQPAFPPAVFAFLEALLTGKLPKQYDPALIATVIGRFQQYSGPVMAKGLEDTALYRYNRLVSLNEVGAHPQIFSIGIDAFHDANRRLLADTPACMLTTSTHDTKRGEDTRARIGAIADEPEIWAAAVKELRTLLPDATDIDANDIYLLLQLLLGAWPDGQRQANPDLIARLQAAMVKSVREARINSDWGVPNEDYETRLQAFVEATLNDDRVVARFLQLHESLAPIGQRKSLIQAGLKLTVPGVPDIYRGAEVWEHSLVDPDNRRPVDFGALQHKLARLAGEEPADMADWKLLMTARLLALRQRQPTLFSAGSYEPLWLDAPGKWLAFTRQAAGAKMLVIADLSPGHTVKSDAMSLPDAGYTDVLTGNAVGNTPAHSTLSRLGIAVLLARSAA